MQQGGKSAMIMAFELSLLELGQELNKTPVGAKESAYWEYLEKNAEGRSR
jgi:hypothetical protein